MKNMKTVSNQMKGTEVLRRDKKIQKIEKNCNFMLYEKLYCAKI